MASATILTNGKALYAYNGTEWVPLNTAGNLVNSTRWQKTTTAAQTSLSGNDDYGDPLIYTPGYEQLYLNGVLLARDVDYTATNGTTITGLAPLTAGHIIEIIAYNNINVGNTYTQAQIDTKIADTFERWTKTVSASGTVISGLDDSSVTLDYTAGLEKVYVNGILLAPEEYVATSGSIVTLDEAVVTNDIIQIHTLKNFRVANHYTINQTDDQFLTKTSASGIYLSQASASTVYAPVASGGLVQITPTSIAATGGSGSISATGAVSFTSASAISLNDVFSTTYDNYRIIMNITGSTTNVNVGMRLRVSAADNTTTNYGQQTIESGGTSVSAIRDSGQTQWFRVAAAQTGKNQLHILEITNPFQTEITSAIGFRNRDVGTSSAETSHVSSGFVATTSFTGFTLIPTSGTITGTVSVYGYRK